MIFDQSPISAPARSWLPENYPSTVISGPFQLYWLPWGTNDQVITSFIITSIEFHHFASRVKKNCFRKKREAEQNNFELEKSLAAVF